MLPEQRLWSIVVAREQRQGSTGVQDGAGGVHGTAGRVRGRALAPEHPFPAAVDDALTAYRFSLSGGADPAAIAIAGDSAGGA
jgi:alpha/beta hydrolase fold